MDRFTDPAVRRIGCGHSADCGSSSAAQAACPAEVPECLISQFAISSGQIPPGVDPLPIHPGRFSRHGGQEWWSGGESVRRGPPGSWREAAQPCTGYHPPSTPPWQPRERRFRPGNRGRTYFKPVSRSGRCRSAPQMEARRQFATRLPPHAPRFQMGARVELAPSTPRTGRDSFHPRPSNPPPSPVEARRGTGGAPRRVDSPCFLQATPHAQRIQMGARVEHAPTTPLIGRDAFHPRPSNPPAQSRGGEAGNGGSPKACG